jgi:shikimate dehydrogenase
MIELSGETRIFPIVGDPIAQVRSPKFLTQIMEAKGINGIVPPFQVKSENIEQFFSTIKQTQNIDGLVVTLPHKSAALALCDQVTNRASIIGSVNITRRLSDGRFVGDNTDGEAYITAVRNCGGNPAGKRVIQIGVGGAGSAVAYEFLAQGAAELHIFDLDQARLKSSVYKLNTEFPGRVFKALSNDPSGMDIVANVTPVGMRESDPTPVPADKLTADMFYADAITKPAITRLGEAARALGCKASAGADMFDAQALKLVEFMTDPEDQFLTRFNEQVQG